MRNNITSLAVAATITCSSATAFASTLIIEPASPNLVPSTFEYRFDATRKWFGCFHYDVLQGSGWYPGVWYHTGNFTPVDGDYEVDFKRTVTERYCAAEMGIYNYVQLAWTNPADPTQVYRGVLQVDARSSQRSAKVTCTLVDATDPWNAIQCEGAAVNLAAAGDLTIAVSLVGLE